MVNATTDLRLGGISVKLCRKDLDVLTSGAKSPNFITDITMLLPRAQYRIKKNQADPNLCSLTHMCSTSESNVRRES
jgi:hypothetical protein